MNHHSLVSSNESERASQSSQTNQSRRTMQAPTNLQADSTSNQFGGPTTQHGMYALPHPLNAQQTTYSYDAATPERPNNGLNNRGLNARTGFNHLAQEAPPPDLSSAGNDIVASSSQYCFAGIADVDCECDNCVLSKTVLNTSSLYNIDSSSNVQQSAHYYPPYPRVDQQGHLPTGSTASSSLSYNTEAPNLTYSSTANNGLHLAPSPYGNLLASVGHANFSFDPSLSWEQNYPFGRSPGGSYEHNLYADDMRLPRYHNAQGSPIPQDAKQRRPPPFQATTPYSLTTTSIASLDRAKFLEVQEVLRTDAGQGKPLSDERKESLANFLGISAEQLHSCLEAKRALEPVIKSLCSKAQIHGLPTDYTIGWFEQLQASYNPDKGSVRDSAYHSLNSSRLRVPGPPKKRRKITRPPSFQRKFQCTHRYSNGTFCLQESDNLTDWKRHEETHYPQRQFECLADGVHPQARCHVCNQHLDPDPLRIQQTHAGCFGQNPRKGHIFPRKDKLVPHVREKHGFEPKIESWHYPVTSPWKTRCGFCGKVFVEWDGRCDHVSKHFLEGKRMIPDWKDPWPTEEVANAPDDDNDDDEDGHGDDQNGNSSDKDADGDDDPDHYPDPQPRKEQDGSNGRNNRDHGSSNTDDFQNHDSSCSNSSGNRNRQHDFIAYGRSQALPSMHNNLSLRQLPSIRGPGGNDDVFRPVRKLGYGTFGFVDEVEHTATKAHFARKTVIHRQAIAPQRELAALRNLKHLHIVNLTASYTFENQFSIIMSPVANCNLSDYMMCDFSPMLERIANLARWIGCLASAVSYIHEKSCQHLDIKPSNILIANGQVVLSDFGGAVFLDGSHTSSVLDKSYAVTPMYCAPEIANRRGSSFIAGASDIYSLGCVFLEMSTVIHRQSLEKFEQLRAFNSKDAAYYRNPRKSLLWLDHLLDIESSLGLPGANQREPVASDLQVIHNMLSEDWTRRPTARIIEESLHMWYLQSQYNSHDEKFLIIAQDDNTGREPSQFDQFEVVRRWLHDCETSHTTCSSTKEAFTPTRVLNVGIDGDNIRLESSNSSSPYVALSYCWGTKPTLKTTLQTLDRMSESIPVSKLSNTFWDAVRITRALGFHYLWIDALCIVQDSKEDWTAQVSQMSKIYSSSTLTICIESGTQSSNAAPKNMMLDTKSHASQLESPCSACDKGYKAFRPLVHNTVATMLLDSKWSKRGWTFQERILSPRILYYSSTNLAWECDGERSRLDRVGRIRDSLKKLGIGSNILSNKQEASPSFLLSSGFRKTWRDVVREFSKRSLSYSEDKLPALSGIASAMASISYQTYVAGLWMGNLITDLLWCRDFPTIPLPRPEYRAPSWSWAAVDSPIVWSKSLDCPVEKHTQILRCQTKVLSPLAPFAGVSDGYLEIKGLSRKVVVITTRPEEILDRGTLRRLAFAQWDALDVHHTSSTDPRLHGLYVEELLCLQILSEVGLLLRKIIEGDSVLFQRVGIYWNQTDEASRLSTDEAWKLCTLTII